MCDSFNFQGPPDIKPRCAISLQQCNSVSVPWNAPRKKYQEKNSSAAVFGSNDGNLVPRNTSGPVFGCSSGTPTNLERTGTPLTGLTRFLPEKNKNNMRCKVSSLLNLCHESKHQLRAILVLQTYKPCSVSHAKSQSTL